MCNLSLVLPAHFLHWADTLSVTDEMKRTEAMSRDQRLTLATSFTLAGAGVLAGIIVTMPTLIWLAIGCAAILFAFALIVLIRGLLDDRKLRQAIVVAVPPGTVTEGPLTCRWLTSEHDIEAFVALAKLQMDDPHGYPPFVSIASKIKKNPRIAYGVFRRRGTNLSLVAAFVVYPLTRIARENFASGKWDNSRHLEPSHITTTWDRAQALYVAGLVGTNTRDRAAVVIELRRHIELHPTLSLFARRATDQGERIMRHYGMTPIAGFNGVWTLDRTNLG
jgi:hypothetical protein